MLRCILRQVPFKLWIFCTFCILCIICIYNYDIIKFTYLRLKCYKTLFDVFVYLFASLLVNNYVARLRNQELLLLIAMPKSTEAAVLEHAE